MASHSVVSGAAGRLVAPAREWQLTGRGDHAQPVQGLLGLAGLAGVVGGQAPGAERLPAHEDQGDQGEPAEHGGLAVPDAPPGHPLDERGAAPRAPAGAVLVLAVLVVAGRTGLRQY